ncbi:MAG: hypothetical protein ACK5KO_09070 [Arachnia sp.]
MAKSGSITFRLDAETEERLALVLTIDDRTASDVMREALTAWVDQRIADPEFLARAAEMRRRQAELLGQAS